MKFRLIFALFLFSFLLPVNSYSEDIYSFRGAYDISQEQSLEPPVVKGVNGIADTFDAGGVDSSKWITSGTGATTTNSNKLRLNATGGTTFLESKQALRGDFDIDIDYDLVSLGTGVRYIVRFRVIDNVTRIDNWDIRIDNNTGTRKMVSSTNINETVSERNSPELSGKVRLARTNGQVRFYYEDGGWMELGATNHINNNDMLVQIYAISVLSNPNITIDFDDLRLVSGNVVEIK